LDNHCSLAFGERGRGRGGWEGEGWEEGGAAEKGEGEKGKGEREGRGAAEKGEGGKGKGKGKGREVWKGRGGVAAEKEKSDIRVRKCCFYTFF